MTPTEAEAPNLGTEQRRQQAVLDALNTPVQRDTPWDARQPCWPALVKAGLLTDAHGLLAYQVNARAIAQRVLLDHFPTIAAMLGEDTLRALAVLLWDAAPPCHGDLGEWGEALPTLLAQHPDLQDWPWLADCARLDWARHQCLRAADARLDTDSLARLGDTDADALRLVLRPDVQVLESPWPLQALWSAHQLAEDQQADATRDALTQSRNPDDSGVLVVWRSEWQAQMCTLSGGAGHWMRQLAAQAATAGGRLDQLLDRAPADFDFTDWLTQAIQQGWLWRVVRITDPLA